MARKPTKPQPDMVAFLRPNEHRESPKHPHYCGTLYLEGRTFRLAGWKHRGEKGPYMSVAVEDEEKESTYNKGSKGAPPPQQRELDDDIPF